MEELKRFAIGGANGTLVEQLCKMSNRHGLISGATGTGKTVTLQVLAESFSRLGVPVITADIKGDLSGLASAGSPHPKIDERLLKFGMVEIGDAVLYIHPEALNPLPETEDLILDGNSVWEILTQIESPELGGVVCHYSYRCKRRIESGDTP